MRSLLYFRNKGMTYVSTVNDWLKTNAVVVIASVVAVSATWHEIQLNDAAQTKAIESLEETVKASRAEQSTLAIQAELSKHTIEQLKQNQTEVQPLINDLATTLASLNITLVKLQKDLENGNRDVEDIAARQDVLIKDVQDIKLKLK